MQTDWARASLIQSTSPHTFAALQPLALAMADCQRIGRFSLARPRARRRFATALTNTVIALVADGKIEPDTPPGAVRECLAGELDRFFATFPNWPDAEAFGQRYLTDSREDSEAAIAAALRL